MRWLSSSRCRCSLPSRTVAQMAKIASGIISSAHSGKYGRKKKLMINETDASTIAIHRAAADRPNRLRPEIATSTPPITWIQPQASLSTWYG